MLKSSLIRSRSFKRARNSPVIMFCDGDITRIGVDAIVNAANNELKEGGGIDGVIRKAAGRELMNKFTKELGACEPGEAKVSPGFKLPARHVIHTVGPIWRNGKHGELELLANCYRNSLKCADEIGARSIAFPSISTGYFKFPLEDAVKTAVRTVRNTPTNVRVVCFVSWDKKMFELYRQAINPSVE